MQITFKPLTKTIREIMKLGIYQRGQKKRNRMQQSLFFKRTFDIFACNINISSSNCANILSK